MNAKHVPNDTQAAELAAMTPNPFLQAAVWRLYVENPGLLDSAAYVVLASAGGVTPQQMMDTMAKYPRHKITQEA